MPYLPLGMCLLVEMLHPNILFFTGKFNWGIHIYLEHILN